MVALRLYCVARLLKIIDTHNRGDTANSKTKCEGGELRRPSSLLLEGDARAAGAA